MVFRETEFRKPYYIRLENVQAIKEYDSYQQEIFLLNDTSITVPNKIAEMVIIELEKERTNVKE